jgi:hypothetical protein
MTADRLRYRTPSRGNVHSTKRSGKRARSALLYKQEGSTRRAMGKRRGCEWGRGVGARSSRRGRFERRRTEDPHLALSAARVSAMPSTPESETSPALSTEPAILACPDRF